MDQLERWFNEYTSTPVGSILLFVSVFLMRVTLDRWGRRRSARKKPKKKPKPA